MKCLCGALGRNTLVNSPKDGLAIILRELQAETAARAVCRERPSGTDEAGQYVRKDQRNCVSRTVYKCKGSIDAVWVGGTKNS